MATTTKHAVRTMYVHDLIILLSFNSDSVGFPTGEMIGLSAQLNSTLIRYLHFGVEMNMQGTLEYSLSLSSYNILY
jgi:hypothetical protein